MATNYIQGGGVINFNASADISSGDMVLVGNRVGIALGDIAIGATGAVQMEGVFEVPKEASLAVGQGDLLYLNVAETELDKTATSQFIAGYAFEASATADTTVLVKLNG